jgi:hypothetical protein
MNENAFFRTELDLYLAAAHGYDFALTELRMVYPFSFAVCLARRITPCRFSRSRGNSLALALPPGRGCSAGTGALITKVVATAAGHADDYGGRGVLIQGSDLMRSFAFAPPALRRHFVSKPNFPYPYARTHK